MPISHVIASMDRAWAQQGNGTPYLRSLHLFSMLSLPRISYKQTIRTTNPRLYCLAIPVLVVRNRRILLWGIRSPKTISDPWFFFNLYPT